MEPNRGGSRVAVVTGGAQGIGAAIGDALAATAGMLPSWTSTGGRRRLAPPSWPIRTASG